MYEARQNKEKVSRRIDGGSGMARQKVNNTIFKKSHNRANGKYIQLRGRTANHLFSYYQSITVPTMTNWTTSLGMYGTHNFGKITFQTFLQHIHRFENKKIKQNWTSLRESLAYFNSITRENFITYFGPLNGNNLYDDLEKLRMVVRTTEMNVEINSFSSNHRLKEDIIKAISMVNKGKTQINNRPYYKRFFSPQAALVNPFVKSRVEQKLNIILRGLFWLSEDPYTKVQFKSKTSSFGSTYTNSRKNAVISLGGSYGSADDQGEDSRPGVIIHEISHAFASTKDTAYGNDIYSLDQYSASNNADTYEYFCEKA